MNTLPTYPFPPHRCRACGQILGQAWTQPPAPRLLAVDPGRQAWWLAPLETAPSATVGREVAIVSPAGEFLTGRLSDPGAPGTKAVVGSRWHGSSCPEWPAEATAGQAWTLQPNATGRNAVQHVTQEAPMPITPKPQKPADAPASTRVTPAPGVPASDTADAPAGFPAPDAVPSPRTTGASPLGVPLSGWAQANTPVTKAAPSPEPPPEPPPA